MAIQEGWKKLKLWRRTVYFEKPCRGSRGLVLERCLKS